MARWQLLGRGIGASAIDWRVARGRLHVVHRGVYAVGHRVLSRRARLHAAVLAGGEGAVLSHRSAAEAWTMLPPLSAAIDVTRSTDGGRRSGVRFHRSELRPDECEVLAGIPVTGLSRTLLDLAAVAPKRQVERAMNEAEVLRLTGRVSLPRLLDRHPRRPGTAMLRRLLNDEQTIRGITRKQLEARFQTVLDGTDLPRPRLNVSLAVDGRFIEADCLWPARRLVVELDGRATHGTRRAFERDREKDRLLQAAGWRVVRVTWLQLRDEAEAVVADLRRMLAPAA